MSRFNRITARLAEFADGVDKVTMDVPLLIRMLEFSREDAKDDMILHQVVENMLQIQKSGVVILGMGNYDKIIGGYKKEEAAEDLSGVAKEIEKEVRQQLKVASVEVTVDKRGPGGKATWVTIKANNVAVRSAHHTDLARIVKKHFSGRLVKTGRIGEIVGPWIVFDWIIK